jgi:hypothetical protein
MRASDQGLVAYCFPCNRFSCEVKPLDPRWREAMVPGKALMIVLIRKIYGSRPAVRITHCQP